MPTHKTPARIDCHFCPLRKLEHFRSFTAAELAFMSDFKSGEFHADAGATLIAEGAYSPHLYSVLDGWGFRYKILEDGRRQILNFIVPGDMVGLQGAVLDEMQYSVETLTPMKLCVFERDRLFGLFERHSGLAFDVTWMAAHEERILDEHLLSVGRRTALERASYLLAFLYEKGKRSGLLHGSRSYIPITQQQVSDTLGLSIVHTNKTLRKVIDRKLVRWLDRGCQILDPQGLQAQANWRPEQPRKRPFL